MSNRILFTSVMLFLWLGIACAQIGSTIAEGRRVNWLEAGSADPVFAYIHTIPVAGPSSIREQNTQEIEVAVEDAIQYVNAKPGHGAVIELQAGVYEIDRAPNMDYEDHSGTKYPMKNIIIRGQGVDQTTISIKDTAVHSAFAIHGIHRNLDVSVDPPVPYVASFSSYNEVVPAISIIQADGEDIDFDEGDLLLIYFESPRDNSIGCDPDDVYYNYPWHDHISDAATSTGPDRCSYDPEDYFGITATLDGPPSSGTHHVLQIDQSIQNVIDIANENNDADNRVALNNIRVAAVNPAMNVGIEDMSIVQDIEGLIPDAADMPYGVKFFLARDCWMENVEFRHFIRACTYIYKAGDISVKRCGFYDADKRVSGGFGYGVVLGANSSDCLIEDNVFRRLRHSVVLGSGSCQNVIAYNFAVDDSLAEMDIHGHFAHSNLFEGNCVGRLYTDDWFGPCGPKNTWFRNFTYDDRMGLVNHETFNLLGNEGRLTKNEAGIYGTHYTAESGGDPSLLDIYGLDNTGGTVHHDMMPIYPRDPEIVLSDISYYLESRPDFLPGYDYTWPPIGPRLSQADPPTTQRIPALDRYLDDCITDPDGCRVDIHLGDSPLFENYGWDEEEWQEELAVRLHGYASVAKHIRLYLHKKDEPWFLDFQELRLDELPQGAPLNELSFIGVGPEHMTSTVAATGEVVIDAFYSPLQIGIGHGVALNLAGLTFQNVWNQEHLRSSSRSLIDSKGSRVTIEDCQFLNINSGGEDTELPAGVLSFQAPDGMSGIVELRNCLFADCVGPFAGALAATRAGVTIENCTFHRCASSAVGNGESYPQVLLLSDCVSQIEWSMFTGSEDEEDVVYLANGGSLTTANSLFDAGTWAEGEQTIDSNCQMISPEELDEYVGYINAEVGSWDFRLRHDSQVLDKGDPSKIDFDLTNADMGWTHSYPVISLGQSVNTPLDAGFYEVEGDLCIISQDISAGAIIRVPNGSRLQVLTSALGNHQIGSLDSPRTAIVGRSTRNGEPAAGIELINVSENSLVLEGVLFNYAPRSYELEGQNASLHFYDSFHNDVFSVSFDHVTFENYVNVPDPGGQAYDGSLLLRDCEATLSGLDVGDANDDGYGLAQLKLVNSNVRVENCSFVPTTQSIDASEPALKIHGVLAGGETELVENVFHGATSTYDNPMLLDVTESTVRMEGNQFLDVRNTALIESNSSIYMDREARNHFQADPTDFPDFQPLLSMESGNLDLFCGRNNFVVHNPYWPIISWQEANPETLPTVPQVWRDNFWGTDCADGRPPHELESLGLIPDWVNLENTLDVCVTPMDPEDLACPFTPYTPAELLMNGKQAEKDGDFALAHSNFTALLLLHPNAKEVNDGTLRLKALGLDKGYGPLHKEVLRDDLVEAADSTEANKRHSLSVLQTCSAWCVEARWGDRQGAAEVLEDMLALETDPLCRDTINRAILEIATYPPPEGGLLAASPEARLNRAVQENRAVAALVGYRRGMELAEEPAALLPSRFAITRIYPNPFNPSTTIELALPEDERIRVQIYNILGQQVAEVLNEEMKAGTHKLVFDASSFASGVYFARAETKESTKIKKMLLLK